MTEPKRTKDASINLPHGGGKSELPWHAALFAEK